jgi:hypothetical protein
MPTSPKRGPNISVQSPRVKHLRTQTALTSSRPRNPDEKIRFYRAYRDFYKESSPSSKHRKGDSNDMTFIKALERSRLMPETTGYIREK